MSGNGFFEGDYIGLEAEIKSAKHFPNEPGNWAYFSFTRPDQETLAETAEPFPTSACNTCHADSAQDDFVFTQYYPVLRAAKAAGAKGIGGVRTKLLPRTSGAMTAAAMPSKWNPTAPTPAASPSRVPLELNALFTYLKKGEYKGFKAKEKGTHPGRGPHPSLAFRSPFSTTRSSRTRSRPTIPFTLPARRRSKRCTRQAASFRVGR